MANEDGVLDRDEAGDDLPHPPTGEPSAVDEPRVLDKDLPWPARWGTVLGPGGEDLGDGLVQIDTEGPPPVRAAHRRRRRARHRRPDRGARGPRTSPLEAVRRSIPRPDPVALLGAGVVAGLLGLATVLAVVLFSFDGRPAASQDSADMAALSLPAPADSIAADWLTASSRLEARVRESAERWREAAREERDLARQRERERSHEPPAPNSPRTTQVRAPSQPAAAVVEPGPHVSAAEREFTPGPWNLN